MQQMAIKNPQTGEDMLSVGEVAAELGISRPAVSSRLAKLEREENRKVQKYKLGNMVYILRSDVTKIAQPRLIQPDNNA